MWPLSCLSLHVSLTALNDFLLHDLKLIGPIFGKRTKPRHPAGRISKQNWAGNYFFLVKMLFVQQNCQILTIFAKVNFGFSTLTHNKISSHIVWQLFDMLWAAGGSGCMCVAFEFWFLNNLSLVVSLEYQKTDFSGQKQKKYFFLWSTFSPENLWQMQFSPTLLWSWCPCNKFCIFVLN